MEKEENKQITKTTINPLINQLFLMVFAPWANQKKFSVER